MMLKRGNDMRRSLGGRSIRLHPLQLPLLLRLCLCRQRRNPPRKASCIASLSSRPSSSRQCSMPARLRNRPLTLRCSTNSRLIDASKRWEGRPLLTGSTTGSLHRSRAQDSWVRWLARWERYFIKIIIFLLRKTQLILLILLYSSRLPFLSFISFLVRP